MQKQQLFASERLDGVFFRREPRGDKPGDEGEQNALRDQNERGREGKLGDARYAYRRSRVKYRIYTFYGTSRPLSTSQKKPCLKFTKNSNMSTKNLTSLLRFYLRRSPAPRRKASFPQNRHSQRRPQRHPDSPALRRERLSSRDEANS